MEAAVVGTKRVLRNVEEAKSPHRILLRSLLKSRNKLRARYNRFSLESGRVVGFDSCFETRMASAIHVVPDPRFISFPVESMAMS